MVTQHLLSIVIFLLEMTMIEDEKKTSHFGEPLEQTTTESVCEAAFEDWFPTDDIIDNFLVTIKKFQTSELKFENDGFKAKFLANLFNSLMSEDFNMIRGIDDEADENPTVQLENDDDEQGQARQLERHFSLQPSWADYICSGDQDTMRQQIEEQFSYLRNNLGDERNLEEHDDDDDDDEYMADEVQSAEQMQVESQMTESEQGNEQDGGSSSEPSSSQATGGSSSPRLSFSKAKPLKFEYDVDDSFLSALLKLYSKLNEKRDSFKTDPESLATFDLSSRIGDGPYFIGCLIKRYIHAAAKRIELKKQSLSIDQADNVHPSSQECIAQVIAIVDATRRQIWPTLAEAKAKVTPEDAQTEGASSSSNTDAAAKTCEMQVDAEELERAEKKRRALELKAQIMNKFRTMQNAFMESNKSQMADDSDKSAKSDKSRENDESNSQSSSAEQSSSDQSPTSETGNPSSSSDSQVKYNAASYQCVICGVTDFSTLERSFVQIVLLQSTSILGNAQAHTLGQELSSGDGSSKNVEGPSSSRGTTGSYEFPLPSTSHIPTSDEEQTQFTERNTFADFFERRLDAMFSEFSTDSWLRSFNIGWCGGVHTQSCGHFMHMDCYQSFITSIYQNRESKFD